MNPSRLFTTLGTICAAIASASLLPTVAHAETPKVLVLPYSPLYESIPRATGEQIANTLEDGLRGNSSISLLSLPKEGTTEGGHAKAATDEQKAAVMEARSELDRGKSLFARKRIQPALTAFDKVIDKLVANHPALEDTSDLVDAYLRKGAALFLMGREKEAAEGPLVQALTLDPTLRVEPSDDFGPPYVELIEKVRAEDIAKRGSGNLRVDTTPPGALVWVDGKEALTSPVMVSGLIPGTHFVTIKLPSTDAYTEKVEIQKDGVFHISPDEGAPTETGPVGTLVTHLSNNRIDDEAKGQVDKIAADAGADLVVIGGAFADGAEMGIVSFLYSPKDGTFTSLQRITLNREMLGATIEINKVSTELLERVSTFGEPLELPTPLASEAKAGAEKINEVDFTVNFAVFAEGAKDVRPAGPVRQAPTGPRRPIGGRTPIGGGGTPPAELGAAPSTLEEAPVEDFADAPATDFLDFKDPEEKPAVEQTRRPAYSYTGGISIADEVPLDDRPEIKKESGLLSKWWFWTGAAVVVGGAVTAGMAMGGGPDGSTATVKW